MLDRRRWRARLESATSAAHDAPFALPQALTATSADELSAAVSEVAGHESTGNPAIWIVKPALACGLDHAHEMALAIGSERLPAAVRFSLFTRAHV